MILGALLLALAALGTLYYALSTLVLISHFRCPKPTGTGFPGLSILKPVSGIDADARANFLSYLNQDYPDYEVIFGVLDSNDPAIPLLNEIIYEHLNASLHIGSAISGANNKVRILHNLASHATGDILVITDSDTRAAPGFLRAVTRPFELHEVGAVTCMYRGIKARTLADALEGLHMTCVFAPGVASANCLSGIDFGLGATIAIRREALDAIGGFQPIADHLADDFQLLRRASLAGYGVELSDYVMDITLGGETLGNVLARDLRWSVTTRVSRPWGHLGLVVTFGFPYAVLFCIISGFSTLGWLVLIGTTAIRLVTAFIGARICLGDSELPRRLHLLPIRDILSLIIWIAGYFTRTVRWRGRLLRLTRDGRMVTDSRKPYNEH
ncbi:MAG: glycosyltransferase [Armatimonadetes bacterium]|nr:glycosyltransferase [Armatimonadota bacterium]